jgi:hypothetical protein
MRIQTHRVFRNFVGKQEDKMSTVRHVDLPDDQEGYRGDNLRAESLETSRKSESLAGVRVEAQSGGSAEELETFSNSREAETKLDPWMEAITAFIRKIDIESL